MAGEPALALAEPFVGMLGAVARLFGVPHAAQTIDDLLAHLLGEDAVSDAFVGFLGTDGAGAWLAHRRNDTPKLHLAIFLQYVYFYKRERNRLSKPRSPPMTETPLPSKHSRA